MEAGVRSSGLVLLCLTGAGLAMAAAPKAAALPVQCTAAGSKFFVPAMTSADVCARFVHALGGAIRIPRSERLLVELRFLPRGIANAKATWMRAGRATPLPVYELAISDRQFMVGDIDTLAGDAARGLMAAMPGKGKG